jgi:putative ABC transport system permease protein
MTGLRWRYIWRTLWHYQSRTILIILSVAVGIFAFGLIIGTVYMLATELPVRYQEVAPASAVLHTTPLDLESVESIRRMPEVGVAEGRANYMVQYRQPSGEWHDLQVFALEDYAANRVDIIRPYRGAWPPPENTALIERNSLPITGLTQDDALVVENARGDQRVLPIAGITHDMNQAPAQITGVPYAYVTRDTLVWLGLPRTFNEVHLLVAEDRFDKAHITRVAQEAADKLERSGATVYWTEVPEPGEHFANEFLPTIVAILSSLGLLALILSSFLVINVITAMLTQQTRQIGVMKAIGARPPQIADLYLRMALCFGLGALLLAIPLGTLGARIFSDFLAGQLNFDLEDFRPAPQVLALQIAVGVIVPIAAALFPVLATVRRSVREALQDTGLEGEAPPTGGMAQRLLRLQLRMPLSRPLRLSLRNTFRRRGRLVRTLIPLILGGAIFMSVLSVRASLFRTLEETLVERGFDVQIQLDRPYAMRRIEHEVAPVPGVATLEGWTVREAVPVHADGSQGDSLRVTALPATTQVFQPNIVRGRWLRPDDTNAIVVPTSLVASEPAIDLGSEVTLRIGDDDEVWRVVGVNQVFQPPIAPAVVYVNQPYFWERMGAYGRVETVRIFTHEHDAATHRAVGQEAEARLQNAGLDVRSTRTATEDRRIFTERFNIITVVLMIMAFLLATVGSLGLMGTMSINVLERRREIGVMRAIGASDHAIVRIFVVEGVVISVLSWGGALLLSQPMSRALSFRVGMTFAQLPLSYIFDLRAPLFWLLIIVTVSALASLVPARSAASISVRETLAYE